MPSNVDVYVVILYDSIWCRAAIFVVHNFPFFKKATLEALETIFATKTLGRQLALVSTNTNLGEDGITFPGQKRLIR